MGITDYNIGKITSINTNVNTINSNITTLDTVVDSIETYSTIIEHDQHGAASVYPTMANGVTVSANAAAWTLGNYVEVVPANGITSIFDIHYINFENITTNSTYELVLYAVTTEIGRLRFFKSGTRDPGSGKYFQTPRIAANTQIQAKLMDASVGVTSITFSIGYHTYLV